MSDISDFADKIELQTWAAGELYTLSSLQEELEAALPDPESDTEDENAEKLAQQIFDEIGARAALLRAAYPFNFDGVSLAPNDLCRTGSSYLFCLGMTVFDDVTHDLRTREFEAIVKTAAEQYFNGDAVRIGAPWKTGEITDYRLLLERVTELIPDLGPPNRNAAPGGGDGGWDVVVVNNFSDNAFPRLIALGNCATGKEDWRRKGLETQPTFFWSFFHRPPQANNICITFVAVPFLMTEDDKMRKASGSCLTFDRLRICEHAPAASPAVMAWLNQHKPAALDLALV